MDVLIQQNERTFRYIKLKSIHVNRKANYQTTFKIVVSFDVIVKIS